ncbi:MAG: phenylalanine--tRNA ligase subunit alpha [Euryarchaeota archaeon]|nr:phenylalanine--tRNA ligase subunit alpha [Euryarchaeota archaeon]
MDGLNLLNPERRMLLKMQQIDHPSWSLEQVLETCSWTDQAVAVGAGHGLENHGFVKLSEVVTTDIQLDSEGEKAMHSGLLEQRLWNWMKTVSEPSMKALQSEFERHEAGPGVGLLKQLGVAIDGGILVANDASMIEDTLKKRSDFLSSLPLEMSELDDDLLNHFRQRKGLVSSLEQTVRSWSITPVGESVDPELLKESVVISELTPELLQTDEWKEAEFRAFDVTLESATPRRGRSHPMQALIERIRSVFLEMGFSELVDDYVQTAGWNMDALFIPQDHPAREMQDTFYLTEPLKMDLSEDLMSKWKSIHEDGGDTGSTGWGGSFSFDTAQRSLLRTHTTVNTIQYLAKHPKEACRVFSVDRVFRKEAIDRTHLPEFHQIEGIIMEEGANLQMLVTTLKTFYAKMGYPEVRVRPAYFPYTEPSLEIEVKWHGKWLELGGAGIFRPEVTEPLGIQSPVLAWGMGLERLAMLVLGLDDIRQLYISDLEWLRMQPLL